ncbi:hypothetical protein OAG68_02275 [bacterium]|nr:hypothetical protein [bacterium]
MLGSDRAPVPVGDIIGAGTDEIKLKISMQPGQIQFFDSAPPRITKLELQNAVEASMRNRNNLYRRRYPDRSESEPFDEAI